jgi:FkbM family methyltransferase
MSPTNNNFWVLYKRHTEPTFVECEEEDTQPTQRKTALKYVKRWRNCIDIGSNVGMWTRELAQKFEQVYCFEPNPNFIECFNKNITENNVELFEFGLSNKEHTASQEFNSTQITSIPGDVQCRTLDSFNLNDIDFIKIDVDGFEVEVLEGAVNTITRNNPVINVEMKELKRPLTYNKIKKILYGLNYKKAKRVKSDEIWTK